MAIVTVNNLQNLRLLILVPWRQALTNIVVSLLSLQIVDWYGVGALLGLKNPYSLSFPMGIVGPSLKGFMLEIDIASTYGPMDFFDVHLINDLWWNLQKGLPACNKWSLLCWSSWESPVFIVKTYPYDTYHDCDITQVTLGVYLLTFLWRRGAVFMVKEGPAILVEGVRPHGPWQKR